MTERSITYADLRAVVPAELNPKRHDHDAIKASIRMHGFTAPLLHDERTDRLLAGHGRLAALLDMEQSGEPVPDGVKVENGAWQVPVVRGFASKDDEHAASLLVADNRLTELGGWDEGELAELLGTLRASDDPALLDLSGFNDSDLDAMLKRLDAAQITDDFRDRDLDDADLTVAAEVLSKPGDVWLLGKHRVVCGDSTNRATLATALNGRQADMVWTDPPYGVAYQMDWDSDPAYAARRRQDKKTVSNDELTDEALRAFLRAALGAAHDLTKPGGAWYVASPGGVRNLDFGLVLTDLGVVREMLIWAKDQFVFGRQDYHWRHEPIFYGWKEGAAHYFVDDRTQDTVWEIARPRKSEEHPTMKPVELVARAIRNSSRQGDLILDPFGGSGTTLIAAHSEGRNAAIVELDPGYVDVICRRYQQTVGDLPVRESDGQPVDFEAVKVVDREPEPADA